MKKILIVDDNQNNRMLLRALVEDYCEDNNEAIIVHEAINGLEASLMAEETRYSLIFMDIMMPEMDGIEATKRIRSFEPKAMIIAVSAVDDGERQRQILGSGAEDYISKPINADIFMTRLANYFRLIDSRDAVKTKFNPGAANVFSNDVYSRKLLFYIQSDDDLAEFWEYYLLAQEGGSEHLSSSVRTLYALGALCLKLGIHNQVIVEESDTIRYMTMTEADKIDAKLIKLIFLKNSDVTDYKVQDNKLTIRMPIIKKLESKIVVPAPIFVPSPVIEPAVIPQYVAVHETLQTYDYMDDEDLEELKENVGKLNSLMMVVGGEIEPHEVEEISSSLYQISKIATGYTDSYAIGQALAGMGSTIADHKELFVAKSNDLAPMCAAFGRDLNSWIRLVFVEGASSVHYMDDTIIANAQMIESILKMDESSSAADDGLDDIFDF
jgi:two-component system chemotaxis response regulator CheY